MTAIRVASAGLEPGQLERELKFVLPAARGVLARSVLEAVRRAEPDAFLVFRPHPDVETGYRRGYVPRRTALRLADAVVARGDIGSLFGQVDAVHCITSLAGFEALLRGLAVTTWGRPFYAGWGLTTDRDPPPRRGRRLSLDALVAGALIRYPRYLDPLTQLPNRRLLLDRLRLALSAVRRSGRVGALLFIDLDNFKSLNDTLGHDKGDRLLEAVARRLEGCVRKSNTVARLGGDEFVIMIEDIAGDAVTAATHAELVVRKVLAGFTRRFELSGTAYHCTPSVGVALFDQHIGDVDELLKQADLAMYNAKAMGRNTACFFDPDMQSAINARVALERELRAALNQHQFELHYQPQVDIAGTVMGYEALIRWRHPQHGLVYPQAFIPLAEETGIIRGIGSWVLQTACRQLASWSAQPDHAHLTVSVNVSAGQFGHPEFMQQVLAAIASAGADPHLLKLELTESVMVKNPDDTIAKMAGLREHGIRFALDDFGTGYSSLSYLKRLPLNQIKIDQSFVRDVLADTNDAAIVRTILALGQILGLEVIAEGVELEAQRDFLARHGCHGYQGYLFGRARKAD